MIIIKRLFFLEFYYFWEPIDEIIYVMVFALNSNLLILSYFWITKKKKKPGEISQIKFFIPNFNKSYYMSFKYKIMSYVHTLYNSYNKFKVEVGLPPSRICPSPGTLSPSRPAAPSTDPRFSESTNQSINHYAWTHAIFACNKK